MKKFDNWNVITHLVDVVLCNYDTVSWKLLFRRYTDEIKTDTRGGDIGYMDVNGNIQVIDNKKYKVLIVPVGDNFKVSEEKGALIWLEKKEDENI